MMSVVQGSREEYDLMMDFGNMNHCDQLGITEDIYGDKHKCPEITDAQMPTALDDVLEMVHNISRVKGSWNCDETFSKFQFYLGKCRGYNSPTSH